MSEHPGIEGKKFKIETQIFYEGEPKEESATFLKIKIPQTLFAGEHIKIKVDDLISLLRNEGQLEKYGLFGFDTFLSPFTWRYGSKEMRKLFSVLNERVVLPGKIWVAVAKIQAKHEIIRQEQYEDIKNGIENADQYQVLLRSLELEKTFKHDVIATKEAFAEFCPEGGSVIHHGMTSMDIVNNVEALILQEALEITQTRITELLNSLVNLMKDNLDLVCMGWTHLRSAEPTTFSYRFAQYAQDLLNDLQSLKNLKIKGKGFKGATGTSASYEEMFKDTGYDAEFFEMSVLKELNFEAFTVTNQTSPRKQDHEVTQLLARIGQSIHRMAQDIRLLTSSPFMEVSEPTSSGQKGSSAMAHKLPNPINSENMCSLTRILMAFEQIAWINASTTALERTLDDSGNRRVFMPEAFLTTDQVLLQAAKVIQGLIINKKVIRANLDKFGLFAGTENLLTKMVEKGMNRQEAHNIINDLCTKAWQAIQKGKKNPLIKLFHENGYIKDFFQTIDSSFTTDEITKILTSYSEHIGNAAQKTQKLITEIKTELSNT